MTEHPITRPSERQIIGYECTRCGTEAREYEPMTPTGWVLLTTVHAPENTYIAVLCDVCANLFHDWMTPEPEEHQHDMHEVTTYGDGFRREACLGPDCNFQIIQSSTPLTVDDVNRLLGLDDE